jgi:hypothetical protein
MKIRQISIATIGVAVILVFATIWINNQSKQNQRSQFCQDRKPLTALKTQKYDFNGVKHRQGTFLRTISLNNQQKISVVIFPNALSSSRWKKLTSSSIQYIGSGGDGDSWQEWLNPDYFYLVAVLPGTTALAFARLCYRNGDVTVSPVNKVKQIPTNKLVINNKIILTLTNPKVIPKVDRSYLVVNAGSDRRDILGSQTEVYFTTQNFVYEEKTLSNK